MKVAELDTILLAKDVADRAQLYCLSCRRRLASVCIADRFTDNAPECSLSISLTSEDLRDFQQSRGSVSLTCGCGIRSSFYLI